MIYLRRSAWSEGRFKKDPVSHAWIFQNVDGVEHIVLNPKRIPDYPVAYCHVNYTFRPGMDKFIRVKRVQTDISREATDFGMAV